MDNNKINYGFTVLFLLLLQAGLQAQEIQWASELISFSSQYEKDGYSAKQVLGEPNKYPSWGKSSVAWAPKNKESNSEYVRVKFKTPIHVRQVLVAETFNPGSIRKIFLYDERGQGHKVYDSDLPQSRFGESRLFGQKIARTPYKVAQLKLVISPQSIGGMPQIDAIGISGSTKKVDLKINSLTYADNVLPPEKLSLNVNSRYAERLPIISPDGQTLYFARKWHPENIGTDNQDDVWISQRMPNDNWSRALNPGPPLNNATHNFVCAVSPDGKTLYLGNDYTSNKKDGLSVSRLRNGRWTDPKPLKIVSHYNRNAFVSYHVSVDGKVMLMTVERDEGMGDRDVYVSFQYSDGDWSEPKNLGPRINTSGMEASVFIAADMKTIYFSSDGHRGYGGLDVFMAKRLDFTWTNWSDPVNLGPVINTPGNDLNYTIPASGEYAYFSSDVGQADLMSNLYRIRLPKEARPEPVKIAAKEIVVAGREEPIEIVQYEPLEKEAPKTSTAAATPKDEGKIKVILPDVEKYEELPQIEGYYPVAEEAALEDLEADPEGIDYDGNDPKIIEEIKSEPDPVTKIQVDRLKKQLALLSDEVEELEEKRTVAKDKVNDVTNTDYQYETYVYKPSYEDYESPSKKRVAVDLTEDDDMFVKPEAAPYRPKTKVNKVTDNPEVTALSKRYASLFEEDDEPAKPVRTEPRYEEPRDTPEATKTEPSTRTEIDDWDVAPTADRRAETPAKKPSATSSQPKTTPRTRQTPKEKANDPKVKALEDKYAAIFAEEEPTPEKEATKATEPAPTYATKTEEKTEENPVRYEAPEKERPRQSKQSPEKTTPEEGNGLDEFFARAPDKEETTAKAEPEELKEEKKPMEEEAPLAKVEREEPEVERQDPVDDAPPVTKEEPITEDKPALAETAVEQPSFDELKEKIRRELENELRNEVKKDLQDELFADVKEELEGDLEDDVKEQLKGDLREEVEGELKEDLKEEIEAQLKDDLRDDIAASLRDDLKGDVESQLRDDLKGDVEDDLRDKLREDIENELRDKMKDDVENQLRDELRDPLKEQLRQEMEYRLKKELEQKLRRELEQTIRRQLQEQQRDRELASQNSPTPNSGKPAPSDLSAYRSLEKDIVLYPIKEGQIIPLNNIYFDANKWSLKEASNTELERAFQFLESNPNLVVEISGHTNGLCTHDFARKLSKERSMAVAQFLIEKGIPSNRLTFKGYGKTAPIASNDSLAGRKKNQRVEMKILEIIK